MKASRVLSKAALGLAVLGTVSAAKADISFNGFGSVFYGHVLNEDFLTGGVTSANPDFTTYSQFGLNVSGTINSDMDFAAQLVATGGPTQHHGFDVFAQWAFLNYKVGDSTTLRFGRQLFPIFMASEYARVGYLLPYRAIPGVVFNQSPFLAFDGAAADHTWQLGDLKLTGGLFGGTAILDQDLEKYGIAYTGSNLYGAKMSLDGDGWRFHLQGHTLKARYKMAAAGIDYKAQVPSYTAGFRYDKHNFVLWTEYLWSESGDDSTVATAAGEKFQESKKAGYGMVGYRIGKFLPRYTYGNADVTPGRAGRTRFQMTSHNVGVNYQLNDQAVFKIDYEQVGVPAGQMADGITRVNNEESGASIIAGIDFVF